MTTYDFAPSGIAPYQFQPTLDGQSYNVIVTWSLFGRRYYLNIYSIAGDLVLARSVVGSPDGVFVQSATWSFGKATVVCAAPHGRNLGDIVEFTVSGMVPDAYNGRRRCQVTGQNSFTFALSSDPGAPSVLGRVDYNISLVAGYFASVMVFRQSSQQFEVTP